MTYNGIDDIFGQEPHGGYPDAEATGELVDAGGRAGPPSGGRSRPPRRGRALPKLLAILVVVAAVLGGGIYGVGRVIGRIGGASSADYAGPGDGSVIVRIPNGASAREVGQILAASGVVETPLAFVNAAAASNSATSLQPGLYQLRAHMSAAGALQRLLDPTAQAQFQIVITPGMTTHQVIAILVAKTGLPQASFEALVKKPPAALDLPSWAKGVEGFLLPATYDLPPAGSPTAIMKMFVDKFNEETASLDIPAGAARLGRSPQDIVTIASIIEREVANADEQPKVARVIYNRLADRTGAFPTLGMDSTTRYALDEYEGPLTKAQLNANNPYNTRVVPGLPPGAISNPGIPALQAALNPAAGGWLWFVSLPTSHVTVFASTQAEWNADLAKFHAEGG